MKNLNNKQYFNQLAETCENICMFTEGISFGSKQELLNCIKNNPHLCKFLNPKLKTDFNFMLQCVKCNAKTIKYADASLLFNNLWITKIINQTPQSFVYLYTINKQIVNNLHLCVLASKCTENIKYIPNKFLCDMAVAKQIIKNNPYNILYFVKNKALKCLNIYKLALFSISLDCNVCAYLPHYMLNDAVFIQQAIDCNSQIVKFFNQKSQLNLRILSK